MPPQKKSAKKPATSNAALGYEAQLWQMADALRDNTNAAEYGRVELGLTFIIRNTP